MNAVAPTVNLQQSVIERIAKFLVMEAPFHQIAVAVGLTEENVKELAVDPRVAAKKEEIAAAQLEKADLLNRGWDAVEDEAVGTVLEHLKASPDPDYALRAASVANKAIRRGGNDQNVINSNTNAAAVISLNVNFIDKLQQMQVGMGAFERAAKRVDAASKEDVERILKIGARSENASDPITIFDSENGSDV